MRSPCLLPRRSPRRAPRRRPPPPPATPTSRRSTARRSCSRFHPAAGLKPAEGADDPREATAGAARARPTRTRHRRGDRQRRRRAAAQGRLQRADLGLARVRRLRRHGHGRLPDFEGRDVQALLDWLAKQPEAQLDGPGDPRVGMTGVSYAGGIELVAGGDRQADRRDRADHRLALAADRASTRRRRSRAAGRARSTPPASAELQGRLDPHITSAFTLRRDAPASCRAEDRAWFDSRGPGDLVKQIRVPTLLVQGTADTLFTLDEAITQLRDPQGQRRAGEDDVVLRRPRRLPDRHRPGRPHRGRRDRLAAALRRAATRRSTPGPASSGWPTTPQWRSAADYPPPPGTPIVADRLRHARAQPGRRRLGHARSPPAAPPTPSTSPSRRRRRPGRRRAAADAHLLRHRHRHPRLRPDRRREAQPRARQPGHADPGHARRRSRTRSPARSRRSPRASAPAAATPAAHRRQPGLRPGARRRGDHVRQRRASSCPTVGAPRRSGGARRCCPHARVPLAAPVRDPRARAAALRAG